MAVQAVVGVLIVLQELNLRLDKIEKWQCQIGNWPDHSTHIHHQLILHWNRLWLFFQKFGYNHLLKFDNFGLYSSWTKKPININHKKCFFFIFLCCCKICLQLYLWNWYLLLTSEHSTSIKRRNDNVFNEKTSTHFGEYCSF